MIYNYYTYDMQDTGQTEAHEPQSIHSFSFIFPSSTSDIHVTGHTASQAPHHLYLFYTPFYSSF